MQYHWTIVYNDSNMIEASTFFSQKFRDRYNVPLTMERHPLLTRGPKGPKPLAGR